MYCIASGALTLYISPHILALFATDPYAAPTSATAENLAPHLTNTCLQPEAGEANVRLLSELAGSPFFGSRTGTLTAEDIVKICEQGADVLAETFRAAVASPVHFQVLSNGTRIHQLS